MSFPSQVARGIGAGLETRSSNTPLLSRPVVGDILADGIELGLSLGLPDGLELGLELGLILREG